MLTPATSMPLSQPYGLSELIAAAVGGPAFAAAAFCSAWLYPAQVSASWYRACLACTCRA